MSEVDGLVALEAAGAPVPRVRGLWQDREQVVLATDWLALVPGGVEDWQALARILPVLHGQRRERFGWHEDNWLGGTRQTNVWMSGRGSGDWIAFFRDWRLRPMRDALVPAMDPRQLALLDRVLEAVPRILSGHQPRAALVHGDLWRGNWGVDAGGQPWLFDPAVSVSDPETDWALLELFGQPPAGFWEEYARASGSPVDRGAYLRSRRPLYQLYHLLNHQRLFGEEYAGLSMAAARQCLAPT